PRTTWPSPEWPGENDSSSMLAKSSRVGVAADIWSPEKPPDGGGRRGLALRLACRRSGLLLESPWPHRAASPAHKRMLAGWFHLIWQSACRHQWREAKSRSGLVPFGERIVDDGARGAERGLY